MFPNADHLTALLPAWQLRYTASQDGFSRSSVPVWAAELPFPLGSGWRAGAEVMRLVWMDEELALRFSQPVSGWAETLALRYLEVQAVKREG